MKLGCSVRAFWAFFSRPKLLRPHKNRTFQAVAQKGGAAIHSGLCPAFYAAIWALAFTASPVLADGQGANSPNSKPEARSQASEQLFTGAGLHAGTQRFAIAFKREAASSGISLRSLQTLDPLQEFSVPEGIQPFDPSFSADGSHLIYAGMCPTAGAPCSVDAPGWNIFELTLETGTSRQLTAPDPNLLRLTPRYDAVTREVYFVGISNALGHFYLDRLVGSSAVFRVADAGEDKGSSDAVFPKGAYSAQIGALHNPIGTLNSAELLGAWDGKLVLKARFKVPSIRPNSSQLKATSYHNRVDERLVQAADRMFYAIPRRDFRDRETANTLLFVDDDQVRSAGEYDHVSAALGPRLSLFSAAADPTSQTAFGIVLSLDPRFRNTVAAITTTQTKLFDVIPDLSSYPLDFEVSGSHAILFVREADTPITAFAFSDWGPPKSGSIFTTGKH